MVMLAFGQAYPASYVSYPFSRDFIQELARNKIAFRFYCGAIFFYLSYSNTIIDELYTLPIEEMLEVREEYTYTFCDTLSTLFHPLQLLLHPDWTVLPR
jgi:hypothetical protein